METLANGDSRLEVDNSELGVTGTEGRACFEGMERNLGDRHLVEIEDASTEIVGNRQGTYVGTAEHLDPGLGFA